MDSLIDSRRPQYNIGPQPPAAPGGYSAPPLTTQKLNKQKQVAIGILSILYSTLEIFYILTDNSTLWIIQMNNIKLQAPS